MGKVVGLLMFLFLCAQVFGQPGKIDSLKVALSDNDSTRVGALMDVAHLYADSAVYHDFVVNCLREAMDSALVQKNDSIQIDIYNYFGLADFTIGDYENATNNFYKALNLLDKTPDIRQQAKIYNNLGMIFDELEDFKKALEFYKESYELDSLAGNEAGFVYSFINLAISYQNLKEYGRAREYHERAFQLAQKYQDSLSMVNIDNNLGTLEYELGNYEKSLGYYQQALELYKSSNDLTGIAFAKNNIGLVHLDKKEYPLALKNFKEALQIATELNLYDFTGDIYSNLTIYYEEVGDYKNAYLSYDKYNEVYDSLLGEKQNKMIRKLEAQYKLEKKQSEIFELEQENLNQKRLINSTKNIQGYLFVIIFLVIVFMVVLFFLLKKEKTLGRQLQEKTDELKKSNVTKDKFFSIIAHDLKNPFNALVGYTSLLRSDFDSFTREELNQIIIDLSDATESGFALLENLLYWTRSQTNKIKVFKTYFNLKKIVDDVVSLAGPSMVVKSQAIETEIDPELQLFADKDMIATVLRNLVFNSIKFSYPKTVIQIEAKITGTNVLVSVIDQGIGIEADKQQKFFDCVENTSTEGTAGETGSGLGLVICREFIEKNNGIIWVESEPGKGAAFRFSIPHGLSVDKAVVKTGE
jgi:signal transduction histidine kinase